MNAVSGKKTGQPRLTGLADVRRAVHGWTVMTASRLFLVALFAHFAVFFGRDAAWAGAFFTFLVGFVAADAFLVFLLSGEGSADERQ
jgi:hypothetical protein